MDPLLLLSFLGAAILLTLMPGPDILFVTAQSISQNKKAGIFTALGLCTGLIVHITAATLGISAIVYQSAVAFTIVKYAGALYLFYLAWMSFRDKGQPFSIKKQDSINYGSLYKKGILMNLLNPKVSLFFLALLPQFIDNSWRHISLQMFILGTIFLIQALLIFSVISIFSEKIGQLLLNNSFIARKMNLIQGALFGIIGLQIAFSEK
ncbi:MAG TPA: LysE family translocator [Paenibacillaceae bacterium]|nr:LysE family translocator [Paenibacillaceae bacterium]